MNRRLVELDENGRAKEADRKRLCRRAMIVKEYLDRTESPEDIPNLRERAMEVVVAALNGALEIPEIHDPFIWEGREGLLPREFFRVWAPFMNMVAGLDCDYANRIEKDGKLYAWVEFED